MKRNEAQKLVEVKEAIRQAQLLFANGRIADGQATLARARRDTTKLLRADMKANHPQLETVNEDGR